MLVLMVTGYFIGRPLPSVSGEATYLFLYGRHSAGAFRRRHGVHGDTADAHFTGPSSVTVIHANCLSCRSGGAAGGRARIRWCVGICFWKNREMISVITHRAGGDVRLFPAFRFMILTGFALYSEHSQYAIFTLSAM